MTYLPLANLMHHKMRSFLSALGIAVGICMLLTLSGLARGTLYEIADRWEAVDADLLLFPRGWGDNVSLRSGNGLWDSYEKLIRKRHGDIVDEVVPVFLWPVKLGGQDQMAVGVTPDQWSILTGGRQLSDGELFDPENKFAQWLEKQLLTGSSDEDDEDAVLEELDLSKAPHPGLEIVIDSRLAASGNYHVGDVVHTANHDWRIAGIVPAGAMTRVFMPRRTAQYLFGGSIQQSTLMFVKLKSGVNIGPACDMLSKTTSQDVVPLTRYRGMLREKFGTMFRYVDAVNVISMLIAFLFIMVTLYTMVLQRHRDIAILKANGASNRFILRQVLAESLLLTMAGAVVGILMTFGASWLIQKFAPLFTVTITMVWIGLAVIIAFAGAILSGLYPAWRAIRVDVVQALTME